MRERTFALFSSKTNGYIEENNENKYLILSSFDESKGTQKKVWGTMEQN